MGHRATYAIRKDGEVRLFFSRWGALTLPEDLFWGPEEARSFILMLEETGEWLDNVWAEGGAALDEDTKTITLFGCNEIAEPDIRQVFVRLMAHLWGPRGWTVRWAQDIPEVAAQVGVDPETVQAKPRAFQIEIGDLGKNFADNDCYSGLLSVRIDGTWVDRVVDYTMTGVLMNGPGLLGALDAMLDLTTVRARHADRPLKSYEKEKGALGDKVNDFALIDPEALTIHLCFWYIESDQLPFLRERWNGWSILFHNDGAEGHFRRMSRELPADLIPIVPPEEKPDHKHDPRSLEECLQIIEQIVFSAEVRKNETAEMFAGILDHLGQTVQSIGRGARERVPAAAIDELSAHSRFDEAVTALRAEFMQQS